MSHSLKLPLLATGLSLILIACCLWFATRPPAPITMTYDGRVWTFSGHTYNAYRGSGRSFTNGKHRLTEYITRPDDKIAIRARTIVVETQRGGRWVMDGLLSDWFRDGSRRELMYSDGELHGTCREWLPSGDLRSQDEYVNGVQQ